MTAHNPFKYFKTSPEIIRLAVMYYIRYPLSFRQVEDILHERGVDICHETVRFWVERFGSKFAREIRKNRAGQHSNWQWHLDEVFVKINGERFYLWRAVDHEGEVLECYVTKRRNKAAAKKFLIKTMRKYGSPKIITTDKLASYGAALREIGIADKQLCGGLPIKHRQCSKSSSRPVVSNPAILNSMPLLLMASLTEQSPRSFGHMSTHRLTAKRKSSPNRGSIRD